MMVIPLLFRKRKYNKCSEQKRKENKTKHINLVLTEKMLSRDDVFNLMYQQTNKQRDIWFKSLKCCKIHSIYIYWCSWSILVVILPSFFHAAQPIRFDSIHFCSTRLSILWKREKQNKSISSTQRKFFTHFSEE